MNKEEHIKLEIAREINEQLGLDIVIYEMPEEFSNIYPLYAVKDNSIKTI